MTRPDDVRTRLRDYVLALTGMPGLTDDQPLISGHVIDSLGAVQLVAFVEKTFGIEIGDADLSMANLDTIDGLAALVDRKLVTA
ncbi:acyl carrier protein [Actinoplanes sp. N902-109]|uniref:acyl carrier protein n=1 Tax=Actinoplanes sp. (strain N902-109) TaxID=649831 RepID=UPI000329432C|nr:acyl carrier protein [Actinoplanes sp. N902-109]AGL14995.1 acyl carrier protein [Actinoplanes sp. N902-109]